jgi:DMSO/TMAO reductase YedYZ molybdopterin-dependent catalytic subunit
MLAIGMNGEVLPREHGFPARIVIPGLYGFISATKWVTKLTLTTYDDKQAYWTERDWATDAPIKISSRIDTPKPLADLDQGEVIIGGVAWAQQNGGVAKVQVRIDGDAWQDAELGPSAGNDYWRQWFYRWDAGSGSHNIAARVIDGDGNEQSTARANPFPEGSSGIQELIVNVG